MVKLAIPTPEAFGDFHHRRKNTVERELLFIERLEHSEIFELRCAVMSWLAKIETITTSGLQFVDLLFVLRERCCLDLDAGGFFEIRNHRIGKFVIPVQQAQFT